VRFAAVDIGSNAVRLFFGEVYKANQFPQIKKISLIRLPIRLGEDVFMNGNISRQNIDKLVKSLAAFKFLTEVYEVQSYRVCATSAVREAKNGASVVQEIKEKAGVNLEIIGGNEEAQLLFDTHIAQRIDATGTYLYIDVGGGSTELTLIADGEKIKSCSFKIGTIRLKNDIVSDAEWIDMEDWIKETTKFHSPKMAIGTGGNINKLYKLCGLENYKILDYKELEEMNLFLSKFSLQERITKLNLRPDRADVITHAARIYLTIMKQAKIKDMFVPKVGLADGIIYQLYNNYINL